MPARERCPAARAALTGPGQAAGGERRAGSGNKGGRCGGRAHRPPRAARRDAEDAVYGRDGYDYDGYRLRVEFPRSGRGTGRGGGGGGGGGAPRGRYGPPSRRSEYRVIVSGESLLSVSRSAPPGSCGRGAAASFSLKSAAPCALGGERCCSRDAERSSPSLCFCCRNTGGETLIRF